MRGLGFQIVVVTYFNLLLRHSYRETEETHEAPVSCTRNPIFMPLKFSYYVLELISSAVASRWYSAFRIGMEVSTLFGTRMSAETCYLSRKFKLLLVTLSPILRSVA